MEPHELLIDQTIALLSAQQEIARLRSLHPTNGYARALVRDQIRHQELAIERINRTIGQIQDIIARREGTATPQTSSTRQGAGLAATNAALAAVPQSQMPPPPPLSLAARPFVGPPVPTSESYPGQMPLGLGHRGLSYFSEYVPGRPAMPFEDDLIEEEILENSIPGFPRGQAIAPGVIQSIHADAAVIEGGGGMESRRMWRRGVTSASTGASMEPMSTHTQAKDHPRSLIPDRLRFHHQSVKGLHLVMWGRAPYARIIWTYSHKRSANDLTRALNMALSLMGAANPFSIEAAAQTLFDMMVACSGNAGAQAEVDPPLPGQ
jgi:hypothetical protein